MYWSQGRSTCDGNAQVKLSLKNSFAQVSLSYTNMSQEKKVLVVRILVNTGHWISELSNWQCCLVILPLLKDVCKCLH